jgi:hypothetical protein
MLDYCAEHNIISEEVINGLLMKLWSGAMKTQ